MKKIYKAFYIIILGVAVSAFTNNLSAQPVNFDNTPDTIAVVLKPYTYYATATASPAVNNYSLDISLAGMLINSSTGLITWTPTTATSGGRVVVRATNSEMETGTQEFYIYVSSGVECASNVEAYWRLDEQEGPTYKDSYGTADANTNSGGSLIDTIGMVHRAQIFDPLNDNQLSVPNNDVFNWGTEDDFSIEFWYNNRIDDLDSYYVMIGRNEGSAGMHWWIGMNQNENVFLYIRMPSGPDLVDSVNLSSSFNTWYHVVAVRDAQADEIKLYRNGVPSAGVSYSGGGYGFSSTVDLTMGWLKPGPGDGTEKYQYDGKLDEIVIYNEALSQAQVIQKYNNGLANYPACPYDNFAPQFRTDPVTIAYEDAPNSYQFIVNDIDAGDVLVYDYDTKPAWLNFDAGTRTLSGTPTNNDVGSDSVVIKVNDGSIDVYQRFLLTVVNTNDPPVITSSEVATVNEDEPYSYDVEANDVDAGDNLTFSLQPPTPGWLSVNASSGLITGTPPLNDTSSYNVTVRVTDDSSAYDEQTYILDILSVNDAPVITGQLPLEVDEDNPLLIQLSDVTYTDSDNGPEDITLTVVDGTDYSVVANTITPDLNFFGALVVDIELSDLDSITNGQLDVTVNPINDPPVITSLPEDTAWEGQSYSYVFNATDAEMDVLEYSIPKKPTWLTWVAGIRTLSGTPGFVDIGTDTLTIRVIGATDTVNATIIIQVLSGNIPPHITSSPVTAVNEDEMYLYNITFEDEDIGDVVTLTCPVRPAWLTFNQGAELLSGTPTNDQVGTEPSVDYLVQLRVYDGKQESTQTFYVTVTNINDAPVIVGQNDTIGEYIGNPLTIDLSNVDVEDVDNLMGDLTLTVLPNPGYYSQIGNDITISAGVTDRLVEVNVRVSDLEPLQDEAILYVKVLDFVGIRDLAESNNLVEKIYPVPAGEFIKFVVNPVSDFTIEIIDITGKTVFEEQYTKDDKLVEINTGNIPSGLYLFEVKSKSEYQVGRITVSNK